MFNQEKQNLVENRNPRNNNTIPDRCLAACFKTKHFLIRRAAATWEKILEPSDYFTVTNSVLIVRTF